MSGTSSSGTSSSRTSSSGKKSTPLARMWTEAEVESMLRPMRLKTAENWKRLNQLDELRKLDDAGRITHHEALNKIIEDIAAHMLSVESQLQDMAGRVKVLEKTLDGAIGEGKAAKKAFIDYRGDQAYLRDLPEDQGGC